LKAPTGLMVIIYITLIYLMNSITACRPLLKP
jgi:hypothetical protein